MKKTTTPYVGAEVADGPLKGLYYHSSTNTYLRFVKVKGSNDIAVYIDQNLMPNFTQNYIARLPKFTIGETVQTGTGKRATIRGVNRDDIWIEYANGQGYSTYPRSEIYPLDKEDCPC